MAPTCFSSSPQNSTMTAIKNSPANTGNATPQVRPASIASSVRLKYELANLVRMTGCPLAQALPGRPSSWANSAADRLELGIFGTAETAAELEFRAGTVRHP